MPLSMIAAGRESAYMDVYTGINQHIVDAAAELKVPTQASVVIASCAGGGSRTQMEIPSGQVLLLSNTCVHGGSSESEAKARVRIHAYLPEKEETVPNGQVYILS